MLNFGYNIYKKKEKSYIKYHDPKARPRCQVLSIAKCILDLTTLANGKIKDVFLNYIVMIDFMKKKVAHYYLTHTSLYCDL